MLVRLIWRYLRHYKAAAAIVIAAQLVATVSSLLLPNLNAKIIDQGVSTGDTGYIWRTGLLMLAISVGQIGGQMVAAFFGARLAMGVGCDIRAAFFDRTLTFSQQEVNRFGAPSLITRNTNDVQQVQQLLLMTAIMLIGAPITMVGAVFMALREDMGLSWIILAAIVALGVCVGIIVSRMSPLFGQNQLRLDAINRVLREQLSGIRVIRAFIREPSERKRFNAANTDIRQLGYRIGTLFAFLFPVVGLVMNLSSAAVWWFGGMRADNGQVQVGQLTAFMTYLMQVLMSVMMATVMSMIVPRASISAKRIMDVFLTKSSVVQAEHPVTELTGPAEMDFDHVEFSYPGAEAPVLHDISLELRPGTTTAVIGSTGSGKTTLVQLIPRLYDATKGKITINGVDTRDLDMDLLWSKIGLIPQKAYLFSGTVASNLRYGKPDATDDEMWEALRVAQADDFVRQMDGQLDAPIAQGGTNVSGGQRQRLSIARALVKKPDFYVFDDAFSALDVSTDARVRAALAPTTKDAAVLIVAQRVSTIRHADQIIVLDSGHIVGRGTHAELLESSDTYREIVESQMSALEAA
ncbi:IM-ABC protein of drug, protein or lipid ABC transporter (DPL:LLP) [Propionibacterium freudenreichii]|uniref:ABC transporter ATP-binding protein n=1 Tax=Propionibacterium freudenreichii TaxID=1744 RepID=UPI000543521A|nr:ABC transporter ATP-binding protein [Propionibacterium freudenreichii]CEH05012.1 IM-ABC protein of drug, protein or lipid ABC transporter (DPL:LLP) [Propionibacterium freudenreichii]